MYMKPIMDKRNKVARLSLISTIIQGISLVITVALMIALIVFIIFLIGVIRKSGGMLEYLNPDDVTAGWKVLLGIGGSVFGVLELIVAIGFFLMFIGPIVVEAIIFRNGICTYKKRDTDEFKKMVKNDSISKLVVNGIYVMLWTFTPISEGDAQTLAELFQLVGEGLLFSAPSVACVIISILALNNMKDIEEHSKERKQDYIEYYEDNSPYFGQ